MEEGLKFSITKSNFVLTSSFPLRLQVDPTQVSFSQHKRVTGYPLFRDTANVASFILDSTF